MSEIDFKEIYHHIYQKLREGLSPRLTYHNLEHTFDVLQQAVRLAQGEGVRDENTLNLIKVAALYHDTGFLVVYKGHEEEGCNLARKELPGFGLNNSEISLVCGMIMATKLPQTPKTRLEEIIADADLDYLGRQDFEHISDSLRREFLDFGIVKSNSEWEEKQISFFEAHRYFTPTAIQTRNPGKMKQLQKLIKKMPVKKLDT